MHIFKLRFNFGETGRGAHRGENVLTCRRLFTLIERGAAPGRPEKGMSKKTIHIELFQCEHVHDDGESCKRDGDRESIKSCTL